MAKDETLADIEEFARLDLRVGEIKEAAAVEGSDKLVVMQVDIGIEVRQIVAGIRGSYDPGNLVGKQVIVLANLKPAKIRGVESNGMILAAGDGEKLSIIKPEDASDNGVRVR